MTDYQPSRWQRPEDGFPSDTYFEVVAAELAKAGVPAYYWDREEDWEVNYRIDRDVVARGPLAWAEYGLYVSWRCGEADDPRGPDGFSGPGWCWIPYSKRGALGDFAKEFPSLPHLAEPEEVAKAVQALVLPVSAGEEARP